MFLNQKKKMEKNLQEEMNQENEDQEEEELLDDDYLLQLHRYLQEVKNRRKQVEQDAQLLDGRLRCLRDENERTEKKIEVTRRKTDQKQNSILRQEAEFKKKWSLKIENKLN